MKILTIIFLITLVSLSNINSQDFWTKTNGLDSLAIVSLGINSSGVIFAGTDTNYIFRSSDNGINWTNLGYKHLKITGMVIKQSGEILFSSLDHHLGGGVFHSTNNGDTLINMGFEGPGTAISLNSNGHIFVGTLNNGIFRSIDNGASWIQINQGLSDPNATSLAINSVGDIFAGTIFGGVFRSTDNGASWAQVNQGITNNYILSIVINSSGDIFAGTSGGGAFRSTDNGEIWLPISSGLVGEASYIFSLLINSNGVIFAGTADGIFRSIDNGENWIQINQGLTNNDVHSLAINSNGNIFAGTEDGIFRSNSTLPVELTFFNAMVQNSKLKLNWQTATEVNNYGFDVERCALSAERQAWEKIGFVEGSGNSNSPKEYNFIDANPSGGSKFYYRLKQIDNDGRFEYSNIIEAENVPTDFAIYQNYPNPFNPSTKIRYQLPKEGKVSIKIYDLLGSEIATLLNENKESGTYEVELNAQNLSSGTYIYRIVAGEFVETRKMSLLK